MPWNPDDRARAVSQLSEQMALTPEQAATFADSVTAAITAEPSIGKADLIERLGALLGIPKVRAAARLNLVMELFAEKLGSDAFVVFRAWLGGAGPAAPAVGSPEAAARDVAAAWDRIARWVRERRPAGDGLRPAALEALQALMESYQTDVPAEWLSSVARHDGNLPGIFGDIRMYTVDQAEEALAEDEAFGDLGWPVGESGRGTIYVDPLGQVVEAGDPHHKPRVVAVSFVAWLQSRADALEAGRVLWHPLFEKPVAAEQFPDLNALSAAVGEVAPLTEVVFEALLAGSDVELPGLGTLVVEARAAFRGHDPSTGGPIQVPARRRLVFTADSALKDALGGGPPRPPIASQPAWARESLSPEVLVALVGALREALVAGRVGCWPGVGEFSVSRSESVALLNPINGAPVEIPGRTTVQFREYPSVRARLNPWPGQ